MDAIRSFLVLSVCFLVYGQLSAQNLCATNPSFEGPSQAHVVPAPWSNCGGTPDTQPGQWGITQAPSDGSSYVSFLQSGGSSGGYYEGASQVLSACMVAGQTYTISMDLAHSTIYNTAGPGDCYSSFAIYGGNGICDEQELLGQAGPIMNTAWQTFTFTWTPTGNWCYITFRPIWITTCSGYINILVDNFGCVTLVGGVVSTTDVSCYGVCDGTATATPTSGTPPYTFQWSNGGTSSSISGLCAGSYDVTITDATAATDVQSGTVNEPVALTAPVTTTDVSCMGGADGTASVSASGGTTAYTYNWSSGGSGSSISGLSQGSYSLTVTDANGCQVITPFTIADGGIVTASISSSFNVSCFGGNNGSATVTVSDGVPVYTYLWCNGQASQSVASLSSGTCTVTVTDAKGCMTTTNAVITEPAQLTVTISSFTAATCFGVCDGTATASVTGGTGAYTYLWGNGQTTQTAANICAGAISLDVSDANSCTASTSVTITEPPVLALNTTFINPGCKDSCDGSATVAASGGTPPYTYSWNDPGGQTSTSASGLCDGAYVITTSDNNGCVAVATVVLTDPPPFLASISSVTDVDCYGNCNGLAQVAVTGGGLPYTYAWSNGDTTGQATTLCQGVYDVTVHNNNGCRAIASTPIAEPPLLDLTIAGTNVTCFGACNGSAAANATGGTGVYSYLWSDPLLQTTQTAVNLCSAPGGITYTVLVTDGNGCSISKSKLITQPTALGLVQNIVQPTTCSSNNGSACVNGTGGVTPYTYLWNDLNSTTDSCITGVYAGGFNVSVSDGMGCQFNMAILITDIAGPTIDSVAAPPLLCFGDNNGSATVSFSGGTASFTYSWYDGTGALIASGSTVAFNLVADDYAIVIQDGNQCVAADTFAIIEPPQLASAIFPFTNATCFGFCNGTATALVYGGTPNYTYSWTNGGNTPFDSGMCAGTHYVFVVDANGCTTQSNQVIQEPPLLTLSYIANDVGCYAEPTGDIALTPSGGTGAYTYYWMQGGQTTDFLTGLVSGTYDVDVTDAQGCLLSESITINEPPPLTATTDTTASTCGDPNGTATAIAAGGTQPWNYVWNPGGFQSSATAVGLLAGTYAVLITDNNNCSLTLPGIVVTDIPGPTIDSVVMQDALCSGTSTGTGIVYVTPGSGTNPLTFLWNNAQSSSSATGFAAGQATVTVSDQNGCDVTSTAMVYEPTPLITSIAPVNQICHGQSSALSASASGGTNPYSFVWSNAVSGTSQTVSPPATASYNVTATDANGCTDNTSITVPVRDSITVNSTPPVAICDGQSTDLTVAPSGGMGAGNYTYTWNPAVSTTSIANVSPSPPGANYTVTVSDNCSIDETVTLSISVDPTPVASFIAACYPDPFKVQFEGGISTIDIPGNIVAYDWNFGDPASGAGNSASGVATDHEFTAGQGTPFFNVSLTVTSDKGCTGSKISAITPPPVANFTVDPMESSSLNPTFDIVDYSSYLDPSSTFEWTFGDGIGAGPGTGDITGVPFTDGTYQLLSHTYEDTGIFYITLTVQEPNWCKDSTGLYVRIKAQYIMFAPNTFSPNSFVEENTFFRPKIIGMGDDEFEIYVFDRWGDKVYEFVGNYNIWPGWDGKANNGKTLAQTDVYVWMVRTEDLNQETHEYIGHVTLLR